MQKIDYRSLDELTFLLISTHSIGRFYAISESIELLCAALEWTSWYFDPLFEDYESKHCWLQRNFTNIENELYEVEKKISELTVAYGKVVTSPEAIDLIQKVYGDSLFPFVGEFYSNITNFRASNYGIPSSELIDSTQKSLKTLAKTLLNFKKDFFAASRSWKSFHRSMVSYNQLKITILGLVLSTAIEVLSRII